MKKLKFQVRGMHCESCAALIEEKLKNKNGVTNVKVNFDSQKGVVFYNEEKINEGDIFKLAGEAGDFTVEKIEPEKASQISEVKKDHGGLTAKSEAGVYFSPGASFYLGILIAVTVFALIGNVALGVAVYKKSSSGAVKGAQAQGLPSSDSAPQPSANTGNQAAIQTFQITKQDNVRGDFNAPITLVEFSDFECPYCARSYPTFQKILNDYKGKVRLVYKHFPLGFHPNSQKASEASQCAAEQGKFWEYHDKLFENQPNGFSVDKFKQWAGDLGLNTKKFNDCLDTDKYANRVKADLQEGQQKGVQGTPATFVNGQLVSGAQPFEAFKQVIDKLLNSQ